MKMSRQLYSQHLLRIQSFHKRRENESSQNDHALIQRAPQSLVWLWIALFTHTTTKELLFPPFPMKIYNITALSNRLWTSQCWTYNNERVFRCLSKIKLYYRQRFSTGQVSWSCLSHGKWYLSPWCSSRSVALWEQITHNVRGFLQTFCTCRLSASVDKLHPMHVFLSYIYALYVHSNL